MTEPQTTARRIAVLHHGAESTARTVDAHAAVLARDDVSAAIASTEALESACEAALAGAGQVRADGAPLVRRLSRNRVTAPWCDLVSRLSRQVPPFGGSAREVVEERLRATGLLLAWCAVEGWAAELRELPAPPEHVGGDGPRSNPFSTPVRLRHGWALIGRGLDVEVSEREVRTWRELDGRPVGEVSAALRRHDPRERPEDTAATVAWLVRRGVVEAPPRVLLSGGTASRALPR
ncbi:hypothetical protein ACFFQW_14130 [Umezawaea endophytica]|uniref:Uncharacterized protein n=1 Tax=Umezawaea endophytica TaxID=1654476 RepID=A0A9X2VK76_9PSEU|nr:hypothetical protein [Umezawaea endophytica]MCS7478158.1 hypothetical protein [Umezawaea endophytica]